jgi:hypothetical protein
MKINTPGISSHDSIFVPESHEPVIHADDETKEKFLRRIIIQSLERVKDRWL